MNVDIYIYVKSQPGNERYKKGCPYFNCLYALETVEARVAVGAVIFALDDFA